MLLQVGICLRWGRVGVLGLVLLGHGWHLLLLLLGRVGWRHLHLLGWWLLMLWLWLLLLLQRLCLLSGSLDQRAEHTRID